MSTRCANCNKKTGIVPFECKCGNLYCAKHRYAEEHSCTYDYKTNERAKLVNTNVESTKKLNMSQNSGGNGGGNYAC